MTLPASGALSVNACNVEMSPTSNGDASRSWQWFIQRSYVYGTGAFRGYFYYEKIGHTGTFPLSTLYSHFRGPRRYNAVLGGYSTVYLQIGNCDCACDCGNA